MKKIFIVLISGFVVMCFSAMLSAQYIWNNNLEKVGKRVSLSQIDNAIEKIKVISETYPDSAVHALKDLYFQSKRLHYNYGIANALLSIGRIYVVLRDDPLMALEYFNMAYPYCMESINNDRQLLMKWNNCMGAAYAVQGCYDTAMHYFSAALKIALLRSKHDHKEVAMMFNNMGYTQLSMKQEDKALAYFKKAEYLAISENIKDELKRAYIGIAEVYAKLDSFGRALEHLEKISTLAIPLTQRENMQYNTNFGTLYFKMQNHTKAIPYFKNALYLNFNKTSNSYILNLSNLAAAYFKIEDYATAKHYLDIAVAKSAEGRIASYVLFNIYNNLATVNYKLGDVKKAYQYRTHAALLQDSINNMEKIKYANQLEIRYRTAEAQKEITTQQLQLQKVQNQLNKRNLWTGCIAVVLILIISLLIQRGRIKTQRQKVAQLKAQIEGEEKERARIGQQLHDDVMVEFSIVRMNLETLLDQHPEIGKIEGIESTLRQLNKAGIKLRQTAHNLMPDALLEEGLIPALSYFCRSVEQITSLLIDFQYYGDMPRLSVEKEIIVYRIVQELVQNIIKHAQAKEVLVQVDYRGGYVSLTVEDDGKGMPIDNNGENGMGLKSIKAKLKALDGKLEIQPCNPQGTAVHIEMNI